MKEIIFRLLVKWVPNKPVDGEKSSWASLSLVKKPNDRPMAPRNREFGSMLWFSRSLSRFETQDIKTQPQINHNMNSLTFSSSSFSIYRSIIFHLPIIYLFHLLRDKFWRILILFLYFWTFSGFLIFSKNRCLNF